MRSYDENEQSEVVSASTPGFAREVDVSGFPAAVGSLAGGATSGATLVNATAYVGLVFAGDGPPKLWTKDGTKSIEYGDIDAWSETEEKSGATTLKNTSDKPVEISVAFTDKNIKPQKHTILPGGSITDKDGSCIIREKGRKEEKKEDKK